MQLNRVIRIIPIVYPTLPDHNKFLGQCRTIVKLLNENILFKHHGIKAIFAEDVIPFSPYLIEGKIPPKRLNYNSMDGWLTADNQIRYRLELLQSSDPVHDGTDLSYPNIDKGDVLLAITPISVETTPEIWASESHFSSNASWAGSPLKTFHFIYHVRLRDTEGEIKSEFFKKFNEEEAAASIIGNITEEHMGISDPQMEIIRIKFGYETKSMNKDDELFKKLRVLFYGSDICTQITMKRAILLFDDLHFHDRPGHHFDNWGLIGSGSQMRKYVYGFAEHNVPVLIHKPIQPWLDNSLDETISSELEDGRFSEIFFEGFNKDREFRNLFLQEKGDYSNKNKIKKGYEIVGSLLKLDLGGKKYDFSKYKKMIDGFNADTEEGLKQIFAQMLIDASVRLSSSFALSHENDLIPFTEYPTFEKLLALRHQRALENSGAPQGVSSSQLSHVAFKIFDQIIPNELLEKATFRQVIEYRQATRQSYENFRNYLLKINSYIESNPSDPEFHKKVNDIFYREVIPEADRFRQESQRIGEELFNGISKKAIESIPYSGFGELGLMYYHGFSWIEMLTISCCAALAKISPEIIDSAQEKRNLKRQNALSYLIGFKNS